MREQVDVVVIGMGVGGEEVAGRLAQAGLAVVGVEDRLVGGECPYWGCVPTKMMIRAADLIAEAGRVPGLAGEATVRPDWAQVATGAAPTVPPIPGLADVPYWTNREAVETEQLPRSLAIIGGGAVGVEFAQVYARFGWASPSSKRPTGCSHSRSPKPALSSRTRSPPTASPFAPVRGSPRCVTTEGCSPSTSTPASRSTRSGCW
jgi:pyruvate/2-oxoglutarate dehydrogenase complex dihydrolipoamide dehydrogenase (E3) component